MNPHNRQQKIGRLVREMDHFQAQMRRFEDDDSPQGKRCHTRAERCFKDRKQQLDRVLAR
ncbi:hypothetical protein [Aromatoleum evansii]|jgi:hypothetical protein|uniref:hypothetical protein n=1 Tax=Aromatoleum evansii TaxID=59406 RepID=UPI00145D4906|nr:hypothetical protein [Aromatoleum evansii]NMG29536.1 hypothetical protein [Aromatoleum evansii]